MGFIGKRELAAWGILAAAFIAFLAYQFPVWGFLAAAIVFISYVSWTTSSFFVTQGDLSRKTIAALAWPVGLATVKAAVVLGVAWSIYWLWHRLFGH
jgi:hypothetical protein